ncbi:similar to Saccharomyces cerevisiae YOL151W GRE2 3-methylbutanal reductase and NADPH-dependent methylglyoxal reductase (D-lactaldehyde dehydrogenase) [Maudiozyma saulgeensis]|uniref:Similar to Saccharomyces cerevisiae YOL151W GRE2 3-methylbutanal reductase and NADPH-dependent methylglyoxal reductase (D-lactaldehyde dehydrogenase) n=1 Tax=Maudiozyma saulgeensis TaxID=1789683 RepID=A0A1X7RC04_9SACH|nr:similar to Saccharomyces cerevisiae YOL151W GRE2 3-methylbutanal reductase and NADPH-dependent methylglyoxal reductase (D-lactaldehyde dehydrogenase) [Kazachstania saulgeensis]
MSVFVSGATGFIAQHIVSQLLEQNYKVIGSARSQAKIDALTAQFGNNPNLTMVVVPDVAKLDAFHDAFKTYGKDIKYVLHTASPFRFDVTDVEKELLIPAKNGTLGILESIKLYAADTVERVVVTSSFAAIIDFNKVNDKSFTFNESLWNPDTWESSQANPVVGYCGSKKIAEETAWKFLEENKDAVKFKLSTVNPVYVFGPQNFDSDVKNTLNTSCELINSVIKNGPDAAVSELGGQFIDVRDVAKAHLYAFQKENTIGKRLLMSNGDFNTQDILNTLNADITSLKGRIPVGTPSTGVLGGQAGALVDNTKTKEILGFEFISFKQTVDDTASQILKVEGKL